MARHTCSGLGETIVCDSSINLNYIMIDSYWITSGQPQFHYINLISGWISILLWRKREGNINTHHPTISLLRTLLSTFIRGQYYPSVMAVTFFYILSNSLAIFVSLFSLDIYLEVEHIILNMTKHQTEQ